MHLLYAIESDNVPCRREFSTHYVAGNGSYKRSLVTGSNLDGSGRHTSVRVEEEKLLVGRQRPALGLARSLTSAASTIFHVLYSCVP